MPSISIFIQSLWIYIDNRAMHYVWSAMLFEGLIGAIIFCTHYKFQKAKRICGVRAGTGPRDCDAVIICHVSERVSARQSVTVASQSSKASPYNLFT
jgi:hypothetical protein